MYQQAIVKVSTEANKLDHTTCWCYSEGVRPYMAISHASCTPSIGIGSEIFLMGSLTN